MTWYWLGFGYGVCGVLSYGILFADMQADFPEFVEKNRHSDMGAAMGMSFGGPISLFIAVFTSGLCEHGLKF